jgi:hypothetical protein
LWRARAWALSLRDSGADGSSSRCAGSRGPSARGMRRLLLMPRLPPPHLVGLTLLTACISFDFFHETGDVGTACCSSCSDPCGPGAECSSSGRLCVDPDDAPLVQCGTLGGRCCVRDDGSLGCRGDLRCSGSDPGHVIDTRCLRPCDQARCPARQRCEQLDRGECVPCGGAWQWPCLDGTCAPDHVATPTPGSRCLPCGDRAQPPCADRVCRPPNLLNTSGSQCLPCGEPTAPCCDATRCGPGATCASGSPPRCVACGEPSAPCCDGMRCSAGATCVPGSQPRCAACGARGAACCPGSACAPPLHCEGGVCTFCGVAGAPCCAGGTCDIPDTRCVPWTVDGLYATAWCVSCGGESMTCCANDRCADGLRCDASRRCVRSP